ncbi:MAG: trimethylamine methyltransferase family protein [Dehalococcoidia bacterium]|nr:trimethylamine methyltransferase family protein [Dehalococcoidia bacterium]
MPLKGYTVSHPINILTEDQVERIHSATLEILETTGVVFEHKKALEVLDGAGCKVDHQKQRVRFPSYLVEECLRKCPSSFTMKARESKNNLRFGGRTLYFMPWGAMDAVDLSTGARILATRQDEAEAVIVMDALDEIHAHYGAYFNFEGIPPMMSMPVKTAIGIKNSSKVQSGVSGFDWDMWQIKMAQVTNQELMGAPTGSPPLTWGNAVTEAVFRYTEVGFPILPTSGQAFGASSPATIAGSLALNNAELMSVMVLTQVLNPGNRFVAADYSQPLSMRTGQALLGAVENAIAGMAFTQMWRHYGIPVSLAANSSDSKVPDYQCSYEKTINTLSQCLAGPNLFLCAGAVYDELTFSPVVLVIDTEVYGMVARIFEGIEVTDETLAIDLIDEVGPIPGHYLDKAHTRKWWGKEQYIPILADRQSHAEWVKAGSKNIIDRAKERVQDILSSHKTTPLPEDEEKAIDEILQEATAYYKQKGML